MSRNDPSPVVVVHVSFGLDVGGQEKLIVEFARHCDRTRFDLIFVSLGERGALADQIEDCGWRVIACRQSSGLKPSLALHLARLLRRIRPAVVHTHDHRSMLYAAPAARWMGVRRLVHTCHGRDLWASRRARSLIRWTAGLVDSYVCVSEHVRNQCSDLGIPPTSLCTILNGIDLVRFTYSGPTTDGPLLAVARLNPEKDLANLLRAVALSTPGAPDLRLEIAGTGRCLEPLAREAADLGIADRVKFLGTVGDVSSLLARARVFALSSLSEGIPLTILEAMACGLPVVATRVGGVPEVVLDEVTGLLVSPSDPAALSHAILRLWRDHRAAKAMGLAGRERVEQVFEIRRMIHEYQELYLHGRCDPGPSDRKNIPAATARS